MDQNFDLCCVCGLNGELVLCDTCPKAFHMTSACCGQKRSSLPKAGWQCRLCKALPVESMGAANASTTLGMVSSEVWTPGHAVCVAQLLRLLEVWMPAASIQRAAAAVVGILGRNSPALSGVGDGGSINGNAEPLIALPVDDLRGLHVLWAIAEALAPNSGKALSPAGAPVVQAAVQALYERRNDSSALHQAFALQCDLSAKPDASPYATTPFCGSCGHWRVLRSACLWCGKPHDLTQSLEQLAVDAMATLPHQWVNAPSGGAAKEKVRAVATPASVTYTKSAATAQRGATNMAAECLSSSDEAFRRTGGDMLFLCNNLATAATVMPQISCTSDADSSVAAASAEVEACFVRVATRLISAYAQAPGLGPCTEAAGSDETTIATSPMDETTSAEMPLLPLPVAADETTQVQNGPTRIARRAKTAAHAGIAASMSAHDDLGRRTRRGSSTFMSLNDLLDAVEALHALQVSGVHRRAVAGLRAHVGVGADLSSSNSSSSSSTNGTDGNRSKKRKGGPGRHSKETVAALAASAAEAAAAGAAAPAGVLEAAAGDDAKLPHRDHASTAEPEPNADADQGLGKRPKRAANSASPPVPAAASAKAGSAEVSPRSTASAAASVTAATVAAASTGPAAPKSSASSPSAGAVMHLPTGPQWSMARCSAAGRAVLASEASADAWVRQLANQVAASVQQFDEEELFGWCLSSAVKACQTCLPHQRAATGLSWLPRTRREHCAHCGFENASRRGHQHQHGASSPSAGSNSSRGSSGSNSGAQSRAASSSSSSPTSPAFGGFAGEPVCCAQCGHRLRACVDYGALTDTFVWLYLFQEARIPVLTADRHRTSTKSVTSSSSSSISSTRSSSDSADGALTLAHALGVVFPAARCCYAPCDELGHDFFKLQCYFVTHVLYVFSDWGAQPLCRSLFAEELCFLLRYMPQVLRLKDPELVAEFVHCLRLFQVEDAPEGLLSENGASSKEAGQLPPGPATAPIAALLPQCAAVAAAGVSFLVAFEAKKGSCGQWSGAYGDSLYNRYHAAYCGAHALWPFSFHQSGKMPAEAETAITTTTEVAAATPADTANAAGAPIQSAGASSTGEVHIHQRQSTPAPPPPPPRGVHCPAAVWQLTGYQQPPTETNAFPLSAPVECSLGGAGSS